MTSTDPSRHWDGQQWLRWNGAQWAPESQPLQQYQSPQPMYQPAYAPQPQFTSDKTGQNAQVIIAWILTVVTLGYFLPWAIAATRGKANAGAIGLLNFLLGWTVVGWIVALVMACSAHQVAGAHSVTMVTAVGVNTYYPPPAPAPGYPVQGGTGQPAYPAAPGYGPGPYPAPPPPAPIAPAIYDGTEELPPSPSWT
jgi:hypothetical protein